MKAKKKHLFPIISIFMRISLRHLSAFGLVFFGSVVIVLGVLQVGAYLKEPYTDKEQAGTSSEISDQILASSEVQDLHLMDSDKDGLSDFDELNVYKTSPYLADTDSDGITDKVEIDAFEDPNCPAGYVCDEVIEGDQPQVTERPRAKEETLPAPLTPPDEVSAANGSAEGVLVPDSLRKKSETDSDQQISQSENNGNTGNTAEQNSVPSPKPSTPSPDALPDGSLAEVRDLLIQRGVEKSVLDSFSDDELKLLLEEVIKEEELAQNKN